MDVSDRRLAQIEQVVEKIKKANGDMDIILSRLAMDLQADICSGHYNAAKHKWLVTKDQLIVDPYASLHHRRFVASNKRVCDLGPKALNLGLFVHPTKNVRGYTASEMIPLNKTDPEPSTPIADTKLATTEVEIVEPKQEIPTAPAKSEPIEEINNDNRMFIITSGIGIGTESPDIQYPYMIHDIKGNRWSYRCQKAKSQVEGVISCTPYEVLYVQPQPTRDIQPNDVNDFIVPLLAELSTTSSDRISVAFNVLQCDPDLEYVAFSRCNKNDYPYPDTDGSYSTSQIIQRCVRDPCARRLLEDITEKFSLCIMLDANILYLKIKDPVSQISLCSAGDGSLVASEVEDILQSEDDKTKRIVIHTSLLQPKVTRSRFIAERHIKHDILASVVRDMSHYGQIKVSRFKNHECILTVHSTMRTFCTLQRNQALQALYDCQDASVWFDDTTQNKGRPLIQISKGMLRSDIKISPLLAEDDNWYVYHPIDYKKGELKKMFKEEFYMYFEPLITREKYALIFSANMSELLVRPTIDSYLRDKDIKIYAFVDDARIFPVTTTTTRTETRVEIPHCTRETVTLICYSPNQTKKMIKAKITNDIYYTVNVSDITSCHDFAKPFY